MLTTNYKEEFLSLCLQIESFENQIRNTFSLPKKGELNKKIKLAKERIDKILDLYNRGQNNEL